MVLSDRTIKEEIAAGRLVFDPYDEALVQPSSVDMRVDRSFRVFNNSRYPYIDVREPMENLTELVTVEDEEPFVLHPGEFVLGQTLERVRLPDDLVARLEGKSSLGRLGLVIHSTAGFVDPGFEGNLTLELSNLATLPITIYHGMPIGQISFMRMDGPVEHAYGAREAGSKYQGQAEPTASRFYLNFPRAIQGDASPASDSCGGCRPLPLTSADAQHWTAGDSRRSHHRPDHLRAEAPAGARPVDGAWDPRVQGLALRGQGRGLPRGEASRAAGERGAADSARGRGPG